LTGTPRGTLTGHTDSVTSSVYLRTDDGADLLVTAGLDGQTRAWDLALTAAEPPPRVGHLDTVTSVASMRRPDDHQIVVSAGRDGAVLRWDARTGEALGLVHATENPIMAVAAGRGSDGCMVISGDLAGILRRSRLPDGGSGAVTTVDESFEPAIVAVACSSDPDRPLQVALAIPGRRTQFAWTRGGIRPPARARDDRERPGMAASGRRHTRCRDRRRRPHGGGVDGRDAYAPALMIGHLGEVTSVAGLNGPTA